MVQGIILGVSAVLVLASFFIFRGQRKKYFGIAMKSAVLLYFTIAFFRYMLADSFIYVINKGVYDNVYYDNANITQSVLRWGQHISYVVITMAVFFDSRLFKNIAIYFCLPFAAVTVFYFGDFIEFFMALEGRGYKPAQWFRETYFALELILALVLPILLIVIGKHRFRVTDKKEWFNFLISLPFIVVSLIPVYLPQSLIGYTNITIAALTFANIAWLFITAAEVFVLYMIFRFRELKHRYMLCMFLALGLFMHYNSLFLMGFNIRRLPVQLCNLGAYFFVIALLIKSRPFFNFTFLANIMGTILAMVLPDMASEGFAYFWNFHYIFEHMQVLVVPALCMLLRLFPRLETRALKHLVVGFSCYFAFCWLTGTIINAYAAETGLGTVNFFFIFDTKKVAETVPFLIFITRFEVNVGRFTVYPAFQLAVYLMFTGLCMLLYWAVIKFYDVLDDHFELRCARINLYEKITGKKSLAKREYDD